MLLLFGCSYHGYSLPWRFSPGILQQAPLPCLEPRPASACWSESWDWPPYQSGWCEVRCDQSSPPAPHGTIRKIHHLWLRYVTICKLYGFRTDKSNVQLRYWQIENYLANITTSPFSGVYDISIVWVPSGGKILSAFNIRNGPAVFNIEDVNCRRRIFDKMKSRINLHYYFYLDWWNKV